MTTDWLLILVLPLGIVTIYDYQVVTNTKIQKSTIYVLKELATHPWGTSSND